MSSTVSILLLAAGASTRLGKPKQLLPYKNQSLLRHMASTAVSSNASGTFVIIGYDAGRMSRELHDLPVDIVLNSVWEEGMASSIRTGVLSLATSVDGVLTLLCDQPLITTEILNTIIAKFSSGRIVATEYNGTVGVPALFGREYFSELLQLKGDKGAKEILQKHHDIVSAIPFQDAGLDIDTLPDFSQLQSHLKEKTT